MVRTSLITCLAASVVYAPLHANERVEPNILEPISQWQVDFGDERCRAMRSFGSTDAATILIIDQTLPSEVADWVIAGPSIKKYPSRAASQSVSFGTLLPALHRPAFQSGELANYGAALTGSGFVDPPKEPHPSAREMARRINQMQRQNSAAYRTREGEAGEKPEPLLPIQAVGKAIDSIDIAEGKSTLRLATGNMGEVFRLMEQCSKTIVKSWGLDPDVQATLSRKAEPVDFNDIVDKIGKTYPASAMMKGQGAKIALRLMIDSEGKPTACTLVEKTVAGEIGQAVCESIGRDSKFVPALDAAGQPVASYWARTIIYRM